MGVDIFAVEQGAINGVVGGKAIDELLEINIYNVHARNASHGGLHHLRIPCINGVFATEDMGDAEPIGNTDNSAKITGILYAIEG